MELSTSAGLCQPGAAPRGKAGKAWPASDNSWVTGKVKENVNARAIVKAIGHRQVFSIK